MAETLQKSIRKPAQDHRERNYTSFHGRTKHQERTIYNGRTIKRNFYSCSSKTLKKRQKSRHINNFTPTNKKFNTQLRIVLHC